MKIAFATKPSAMKWYDPAEIRRISNRILTRTLLIESRLFDAFFIERPDRLDIISRDTIYILTNNGWVLKFHLWENSILDKRRFVENIKIKCQSPRRKHDEEEWLRKFNEQGGF
jgi:hypothetical protein